ncbi:MAG: hypothetical protein R3264_23345, partial [Anaerolineae bacterium]|nr:hypothetical protein [Anaerolineae bacterium]
MLVLQLLLLTQTVATAQDEPSPYDPRFGIVNSYLNTEEASAAGAGWTRVFFRWDVVQPGGPSDWKPTNVPDPLIEAELEAGREIVAVLIGTPTWATEQGTSTAVPPLDLWGEFVFKIANQYQGRISHWVIWNRPDITDPTSTNYTWAGTELDYYNLLREAYLKIKSVDPAMQVHIAGLTYTWDSDRGQPQYLSRLLDTILLDPAAANENYYFDAVDYHLYYSPQLILESVTDVRRILDERGLTDKSIWVSETNAPPSQDFIEPAQGTPPFQITLEEQSAFVVQAFSLALAGGAERVAFNQLRNKPNAPVLNGLLRSDNSRRPAFNAYQAVTTHFAETQSTTWQQIGTVTLVTLNRGGQTTTVLWNNATTPTTFSLGAIAPEALLIDPLGNTQVIGPSNGAYSIVLPAAICSNGANCFIGGMPRLLVEAGSPEQRAAVTQPTAPATPEVAAATPSPTPPLSTATPTNTPAPVAP